ncbi:MAG: zf-HC2 domain-containing protein [bacterium]|nr:zf-HC2 domain-containing protein [bacterium]
MGIKKHTKELLSVYLDQMCSDEEKQIVESHLVECAECRQELEDLRKTVALVTSLKEIEPPENMWAAVEQKIHKKSFWEIFSWRPVPVAVATVTILLLAVSVNKYTTRIAEQAKNRNMDNVTVGANVPIVTPLLPLKQVQGLEKKEMAKAATSPVPAADVVRYNEINAPMERAGLTSISKQKEKLSDNDADIQTPYEIEMDVEDIATTRQRLQALADSYQAQRVAQFGDDRELFYHVQAQQLSDFIREVSKLGRDPRRKDISEGMRETITYNHFGIRPTTSNPQLIRIKFNSSK